MKLFIESVNWWIRLRGAGCLQREDKGMKIEPLKEELIWLDDYVILRNEGESIKKDYRYKILLLERVPLWNQETGTVLCLTYGHTTVISKSTLGNLPLVHLFVSYLQELLPYFLLLLPKVLCLTFPPISVCLGKREGKLGSVEIVGSDILQKDPKNSYPFLTLIPS